LSFFTILGGERDSQKRGKEKDQVGQGTNICSSRVDTIKIGECIGKRNTADVPRCSTAKCATLALAVGTKTSITPSPPSRAHFVVTSLKKQRKTKFRPPLSQTPYRSHSRSATALASLPIIFPQDPSVGISFRIRPNHRYSCKRIQIPVVAPR
jgi:hypothetical protein